MVKDFFEAALILRNFAPNLSHMREINGLLVDLALQRQ